MFSGIEKTDRRAVLQNKVAWTDNTILYSYTYQNVTTPLTTTTDDPVHEPEVESEPHPAQFRANRRDL